MIKEPELRRRAPRRWHPGLRKPAGLLTDVRISGMLIKNDFNLVNQVLRGDLDGDIIGDITYWHIRLVVI